MYTEISNYKNVFNSRIKETYLFERGDSFIDLKLKTLSRKKIILDFTPEYIFNISSLKKIYDRKLNCFFVLREYQEYKYSLNKYLSINKIKNDYLLNMNVADYTDSTRYAADNFLSFKFEDVVDSTDSVIRKIQEEFGIDFGIKVAKKTKTNSSEEREYRVLNLVNNNFPNLWKQLNSTLLGLA